MLLKFPIMTTLFSPVNIERRMQTTRMCIKDQMFVCTKCANERCSAIFFEKAIFTGHSSNVLISFEHKQNNWQCASVVKSVNFFEYEQKNTLNWFDYSVRVCQTLAIWLECGLLHNFSTKDASACDDRIGRCLFVVVVLKQMVCMAIAQRPFDGRSIVRSIAGLKNLWKMQRQR